MTTRRTRRWLVAGLCALGGVVAVVVLADDSPPTARASVSSTSAPHWRRVAVTRPGGDVAPVTPMLACQGDTLCVAVDRPGSVWRLVEHEGRWAASRVEVAPRGWVPAGLACSETTCALTMNERQDQRSAEGSLVTARVYRSIDGGQTWRLGGTERSYVFGPVACASSTCFVAATNANGRPGGQVWRLVATTFLHEGAIHLTPRSMSCGSPSHCVAVGELASNAHAGAALTRDATTWVVSDAGSDWVARSVWCTSSVECVAGGGTPGGAATPVTARIETTDSAGSTWRSVTFAASPPLGDVAALACSTSGSCLGGAQAPDGSKVLWSAPPYVAWTLGPDPSGPEHRSALWCASACFAFGALPGSDAVGALWRYF